VRYCILFLIILLESCTSTIPKAGMRKRPVEGSYQGAGVSKYYLADVPLWANFSTAGNCHRKSQVRFLNFKNLSRSYGFKYNELVQFQLMLNRRLESFLASQELEVLRPKDDSYVFLNVQDQIKGGAKEFLLPKFKKGNVIWIDPALNNSKSYVKLKRYLRSEAINDAVPYLASVCLSRKELEDFVQKRLSNIAGLNLISAEMFSPYKDSETLGTSFYLNLEKFFGKEYELTLVVLDKEPTNILGYKKILKINK
jgi:hypothetical protein